EDVVNFCREIATRRPGLEYWIDGVVIEIDGLLEQIELGTINSCPRGAIAFKFKAEVATTVLRNVTWQVGASQGALTPVAHFDPVRIGGSTVSKASLSNWNEIQRLGISINDTIEVIKANDVIPKVIRVTKKAPNPMGRTTAP